MSQMTRTAQPQANRLTTAPLNALRMSKIIKSGRPLVIAGDDEPNPRRSGRWLNHIDLDADGSLSGRLSQRALDDLGPGVFGAQVLHQLSGCEITAIHSASKHHPRSPIRADHGHTASRLTAPGCSPRRIASAIASSSGPGTSRPARSEIVQANPWMRIQQTSPETESRSVRPRSGQGERP